MGIFAKKASTFTFDVDIDAFYSFLDKLNQLVQDFSGSCGLN